MLISLCANKPGLSTTGTFCKNDYGSSLESLIVTRLESTIAAKDISRLPLSANPPCVRGETTLRIVASKRSENFAFSSQTQYNKTFIKDISRLPNSANQARSQVLKFGGAKYILRGAQFLFLSYF